MTLINQGELVSIADLIAQLSEFNPRTLVLISSDEEGNRIFKGLGYEIDEKTITLYGLDGTEQNG